MAKYLLNLHFDKFGPIIAFATADIAISTEIRMFFLRSCRNEIIASFIDSTKDFTVL